MTGRARADTVRRDRIGILVIHGVGSQRAGYSTGMIEAVEARVGPARARLEWQEVHWAPVLQARERMLAQVMAEAGGPDGAPPALDWRAVRDFVVHNVGDALAYHRDARPNSAYAAIHRTVSDRVAALKAALGDRRAPLVVVAHSLGGHIMSNYIWDRERRAGRRDRLEALPTLVAMITFGCNIPLFSLAFDVARPIVLPGRAIRKPALRAAAAWLNFYDRDDVLGWPLGPLYRRHLARLTRAQRRTAGAIRDVEVAVGGLATGWNPASHERYWTDRSVTRPVADHLARLLALA